MSWRTIVISNNSKLDYQIGYLVVRGQETSKIHINEIAVLIIESTAVSLTSYLLNELINNKVKIIFCDEKRNPSSELIPYYGSHDTSLRIKNQIEWSFNDKKTLWTEIVIEKISKQYQFLKFLDKKEEALKLKGYIDEIEFADVTNREGHAAKVYFNALFGKDFSRTSDIPINAALNYGYSLILSLFNREIVACGCLTQLGFFHDNMYNKYNLSCDLMEPYRVIVDRFVYFMKPIKFETEEKHYMLNILNYEVIINGKKELLTNAIKIYVRSIIDSLDDKDLSLVKFYYNEL